MESIDAFLQMGGYAAYVWPAFGATGIVLVALAIASLRSLRARQDTLDALQRQTGGGRRRRRGEA